MKPVNIHVKSEKVKSMIRDSLLYNGVRLYNSLPGYVTGVSDDLALFKKNLDEFLAVIPDQPAIPGSFPEARDIFGNASNSIIDWTRHLGLVDDFPSDMRMPDSNNIFTDCISNSVILS